jgi:hypothetical protein
MKLTKKEAKAVAEKLSINLSVISIDDWKYAMEVELEHGSKLGTKTNITQDNLIMTGKIALAHLIEFPDYYERLKKMEDKADKYWKNKTKPNILL